MTNEPNKSNDHKTNDTKTKDQKPPAERETLSVVFIGHKPTLSYVLVAVTILSKNKTCTIRARGRAISKAVDVAEITKRKFLSEMVKLVDIQIGSEDVTSDRGQRTVSTIDIVLERTD